MLSIEDVKYMLTKSENVICRADVTFSEGFELKGFKVLRDKLTNKEYVTPPSYKAGPFYRPLFHTSPEVWRQIQNEILKRFNQWQIEQSLSEVTLTN